LLRLGGRGTPGYVCEKGGGMWWENGWNFSAHLPNLDLRLFDAWKKFQQKDSPKMLISSFFQVTL